MKLHTDFQKEYYPQVIEIYRRTGYSGSKIAALGLVPVSRQQIYEWISWYEAKQGNGSPKKLMQVQKTREQEEIETLRKKIAELEEALRIERIRTRMGEKMIEIAESRWHIDIRKKAGTKR